MKIIRRIVPRKVPEEILAKKFETLSSQELAELAQYMVLASGFHWTLPTSPFEGMQETMLFALRTGRLNMLTGHGRCAQVKMHEWVRGGHEKLLLSQASTASFHNKEPKHEPRVLWSKMTQRITLQARKNNVLLQEEREIRITQPGRVVSCKLGPVDQKAFTRSQAGMKSIK